MAHLLVGAKVPFFRKGNNIFFSCVPSYLN